MNKSYTPNQIKWLQIILRERLSPKLSLDLMDANHAILTLPNSSKKIIISIDPDTFYRKDSNLPIFIWQPSTEGLSPSPLSTKLPLPGFHEKNAKIITTIKDGYHINYDFLGLIFWIFNRIEELDRNDLDVLGRFSAYSSHAFKHNYLERPIIDEWFIIFNQLLKSLWPDLALRKNKFILNLSHDVDVLSRYRFSNLFKIGKNMIVDMIKYKNFHSALFAPKIFFDTSDNLHKYDPYNTFEWIMRQSESHNVKSTFYFICGGTNKKYDAEYNIDHPAVKKLMKRIHERGHIIGLHPSFNSYENHDMIKSEARNLNHICKQIGIEQNTFGSRMHFLRMKYPKTLLGLENANLTYDSTLSYADHAGFRCGTCFEYPAYDIINDKILNIRIKPLIAMEHTIISKNYMGLGLKEKAFNKFYQLKETCKLVNGVYTLLWHNNQLATKKEQRLYSSLLE